MNTKISLATLFVLLMSTFAMGQGELVLRHRRKERKIKHLNLSKGFEIRTKDTTYYGMIVGFTDSTIVVPVKRKTGKDTAYVSTYTYTKYSKSNFFQTGEPRDTTVERRYVVPLYCDDTNEIRFSDVRMIKKPWFGNQRWIEGFAWGIIGSAMGVLLLPVAAIDEGKQGVEDWLVFEGVILGICVPPIFIGTRNTKYDLGKKWRLEAK